MRANGGENVAHALYEYKPFDVRTLALLLRHDELKHAEEAYMMYALRYLLMRNGVEYPSYSEYCDGLRKKHKPDRRTTDDIYSDIINQLKGGERK